MIEYVDIIGKRVVLLFQEDDPDTVTLIPGVADLDKEAFMFQIHPDPEVVYEGWDEEDSIGIGCETFENDIIFALKEGHELRKKFNVEYMIILK